VDIDGRLFIQATIRDISGRKRAEAEQRIAEIAFESQEGMYVSDAQWAILRVNRAFSRITGYSAEEAVGQLPGDLLGSGQQDANFYAAMTSSLVQHGSWQGEVIDKRKNGDIFPAWMILTAVKSGDGTLTHYVASITDFTERKAAELEIKNLAFFDPLTNLPNRRLLLDRLDQTLTACARHARNGALLFIDLDNFKSLNDTRGHDIGDLLLQQVAHRLVACVREGDTVARLGGDEFVVMLPDLSENAQEAAFQAETVGEKILAALNQDYELAGQGHTSTPSIGVTLFADQQQTMEELLKRADLAMYQAKAAGRNTLRFFDPAMQTAVTARATMEAGLREAVLKQQFLLHYQAQVRGSGDVMGAEVLVRWLHPERGMVSPAEFIPLAEETGVIFALGSWVLETACQQLVQWAARPEMAHLSVSVNVSVRQFNHRDFVAQVLSVLERTGANPQRLKLELTESLLASNVDDIVAKMIALKARGVSFSLDDFGTGYSSLSYLKRLPLDQLKIDQSFVRDILVDPNDAAIAKMVIALADSLGLAVVAEGVETEAQCAYLASQGCNAYQGYYLSRPLPVKEFERFATQAIT
jgi:diguanylate cyclase (GGDEF)-like protein/PAS domain S-box-containing protein